MKCEGWNRSIYCPNGATEELMFLDGMRRLCSDCVKRSKMASEILEPIDREMIDNINQRLNEEGCSGLLGWEHK